MSDPLTDPLPEKYDETPDQVCGEMALHGHSAPITCLASCGLEATDRDLVLSGASDGTALLWSLRRLTASFLTATARRPAARRCPSMVVRGHRGPVTACAVSDGLGLALTCSDGRALLTSTEGNVLLRTLGSAFDGPNGGRGGRSNHPETPEPPATRYTACALAESGYAALAGSRPTAAVVVETDGSMDATAAAVPVSHELEVYTVNGRLTARVAGMTRAVRCLSTAGRGELLVIGGERLMLEVRTTADLAPVWSLDPHSWASIDCFPGGSGAGGAVGGGGKGRSGGFAASMGAGGDQDWPAVECVELGPNPNAPIVVCVGASDGSLLVQVRSTSVLSPLQFCFLQFCVRMRHGWLVVFCDCVRKV